MDGKTGVDNDTGVASFSEAWIEICRHRNGYNDYRVASFSEAWIEIQTSTTAAKKETGRLLLGGVD